MFVLNWANNSPATPLSAANLNAMVAAINAAADVPDAALAAKLANPISAARLALQNLPVTIPTQAALNLKVSKGELTWNVADSGAIGDGVANNNAALTSAVTSAATFGAGLFWPAGNYLTTATIPLLHTVRHTGPGVIKRGSDTFYPAPNTGQANVLYVNPSSGADTNDGLTSTTALATVTAALPLLLNYGPTLRGVWTFQLAAGTYPERAIFPENLGSLAPVTIKGPAAGHPNVPTAVFSQGYNNGAIGLKVRNRGCQVIIQDILFTGYNGTSSSAGVDSSGSGMWNTFLVNCHFTDCYWGGSFQSSWYDVKGGIFTRCGYLGDTPNTDPPAGRNGNGGALRSLMHSRHSIGLQAAGVLTNGPYFFGCLTGLFAQESCTGHVDWCRFEDCDTGAFISVNSRANVDGSSFKRNKIDLRANGNAHLFISANTLFGTGADESANKVLRSNGAVIVDDSRIFTNIAQHNGSVVSVADTVFPGSVIQTTSATVVHTSTLAPLVWREAAETRGVHKRVNLKVYGTLTGTAGTKVLQVRFGASLVGATFTATEVGTFEVTASVFITGTATQLMVLNAVRHLGANVRLATANAAEALTAATSIQVEALVGNVADSITISAVDMSWA